MDANIPVDVSTSIFARIASGEIPVSPLYEDEFAIAFEDISPVAPIHILVIPKSAIRDISGITALTDAEASGFLRAISTVAQSCGLEAGGFRIVMNTGVHGGQTVPYLHAHVLGGRQLSWPPG